MSGFFKRLRTRDLWSYASGEGASSIAMNGVSNFGMLFYTQIMGMSPEMAGLALSIATVWDAVTDPLMGTISDRTVSRYGRRHPYMLVGGMVLAVSFLLLWMVPESFRGEKALFGYLLGINILMKTAFTVFVVPFTALGFEMCKRDEDRARLQGVRFCFNMIINILFGGLGWVLFFGDRVAADGSRIDGTKIHENFISMGWILAGSALLLIVLCVCFTYRFAEKGLVKEEDGTFSGHVKAFVHDLRDVYSDRLVWLVFIFFGLAQFAMMVVSQVQMFTYVEYMRFSDLEKTFVHTGGMVGFALGSLLLGSLVRRLDKKKTGYLAMIISSFGCLALLGIFTGKVMQPQAVPLFADAKGNPFHLSCVVFGLLQMLWWGGCGILVPTATSMIADLSMVKKLKTGEVTEGRYAAGFSFFTKAAAALGLFVTGYILKSVGYVSGAESQAVETVNKLALMTFIVGPILMFSSFFVLRKYPITHQVMDELREKYEADSGRIS
ncbi:MFS transporter [Tichowtungia aerotolerans]|uniref:MFS transporter n=1 Tax=Tichowtungia aerotolerans TaxID=2697043 RepID=A0A6P1M2B1_9BACT|nr:MFS transporter [Tichowtungia aerotolerans]QHI68720.1 MFS transporter [Tichowtungia aerotolerans]